ncbi:hypothetical protein NCCP2222_26870 [Sporosarcina sp. NCCP-2222]|uniref:hypothetical protein n=1 Tax=Sporosarcina sp. NCCP-2222 TaxID=2935073 RepID=UPI0020862C70|nr:hypothetical protein [Sporosarcina sp. NCCP-2222]GKV56740.1 hypothetical protein NCCP2222_26870 [Sporosarcina sp. NCCP-2222]
MPLIPAKALPHFENMIYLPMLLTILERDRQTIEKGPFKLKGPYLKMIENALLSVQNELTDTSMYLRRHNMKVIRSKMDDTFTEYIFMNGGYEDHRRYLNVRLRNRTEELLQFYITMAGNRTNQSGLNK